MLFRSLAVATAPMSAINKGWAIALAAVTRMVVALLALRPFIAGNLRVWRPAARDLAWTVAKRGTHWFVAARSLVWRPAKKDRRG